MADVVTGAPLWIYLILLYLLYVGIKAIHPRKVSFKRMLLIPLLLLCWSFYSLYGKSILSLYPFWVVFLALGAGCGYLEVRHWRIGVDHETNSVTIPGNYSTLILLAVLFGVKFLWGAIYATQLNTSADWYYYIYWGDTVTSALFTGFFLGRAAYFFKCSQKKT